jgi:hypothetical protein
MLPLMQSASVAAHKVRRSSGKMIVGADMSPNITRRRPDSLLTNHKVPIQSCGRSSQQTGRGFLRRLAPE